MARRRLAPRPRARRDFAADGAECSARGTSRSPAASPARRRPPIARVAAEAAGAAALEEMAETLRRARDDGPAGARARRSTPSPPTT